MAKDFRQMNNLPRIVFNLHRGDMNDAITPRPGRYENQTRNPAPKCAKNTA